MYDIAKLMKPDLLLPTHLSIKPQKKNIKTPLIICAKQSG